MPLMNRKSEIYILTSDLTSFFSMEVSTVKVTIQGYFSCERCEKGNFGGFGGEIGDQRPQNRTMSNFACRRSYKGAMINISAF